MLAFITAQVLIASYAFLVANKECAAVRAFRDYVPYNHPDNDPFHVNGLLARGVVLILASLFQQSVLGYAFAPVSCGLILWVIYDAVIGEEIYDDPYYLGTTSKVDNWLRDRFGKHAGKRKMQIAGAVVVLINLLFILL